MEDFQFGCYFQSQVRRNLCFVLFGLPTSFQILKYIFTCFFQTIINLSITIISLFYKYPIIIPIPSFPKVHFYLQAYGYHRSLTFHYSCSSMFFPCSVFMQLSVPMHFSLEFLPCQPFEISFPTMEKRSDNRES